MNKTWQEIDLERKIKTIQDKIERLKGDIDRIASNEDTPIEDRAERILHEIVWNQANMDFSGLLSSVARYCEARSVARYCEDRGESKEKGELVREVDSLYEANKKGLNSSYPTVYAAGYNEALVDLINFIHGRGSKLDKWKEEKEG